MKFEIYKDNGGKFRFRLKAGNGQTILASEAYESKAGCKNGTQSVIKNAGNDARYERKESSNGKFFFNLRAGNSQVIGTSEMYETAQSREKGIESVKNSSKGADVVDLTVA
ncbi:MAG: YegP family protein [Saprospiraceae bacterium]|nr:YegP family protein [Saprospiraceae bacterium]